MTQTTLNPPDRGHGPAIVIGGGIAGLLAAKVLSAHYNEILIVDRDDFPDTPVNRPGTPQAFHPHRLTPRGAAIIERLFPGYNEQLLTHGAPSGQNTTLRFINPYGTTDLVNPANEASFSRALLEWVLRQRVQALPNVRFLGKKKVVGLQTSQDHGIVSGIRTRDRGSAGGRQQTINATLVIDASGRSSKVASWLTDLGYDVPEPELLKASLAYSTRHYRVPAGFRPQFSVIRLEGDPAITHTAALSFIEGGRAELMLWNLAGRHPATDAEQYEREIAHLASPLFVEVLEDLEPLTSPRGYRVPALSRNHFDRMDRWPAGLLVMGDAFCNLDPIYGQGMTVAAIEAEVLEECLRDYEHADARFELETLRRIQDVIEPAWWLNGVADLRWAGVEHVGPEPFKGLRFAQDYFEFVLQYATEQSDLGLFGLYWAVNSLLVSPHELFNSQVMTSLVAGDASADGKRLLDDLTKGSDAPFEALLKEAIPSFERAPFSSIEQVMSQ